MPWPRSKVAWSLTDAVICSRLRRKADWGFFFQNKSKADADLDLAEPTTFADSWVTACPSRCRRLLENTKHHRSDANRWTTSPGVLTHRILMWEKMKGFCFPSLQSPNWLTSVAWSPILHHGQPIWHPGHAVHQEGNSYVLWLLLQKVHENSKHQKTRGGGGRRACCFCFLFFIQKTKQFPKLKWEMFTVIYFLFVKGSEI